MSAFRLVTRARRDLREILDRIEREHGPARAEHFRRTVLRAAENLAAHPHMGHLREDLTAKNLRFWTVHSHLIVYRPDTVPLRVLHILHGARDPSDLRDRVGEPALTLEHYLAASNV